MNSFFPRNKFSHAFFFLFPIPQNPSNSFLKGLFALICLLFITGTQAIGQNSVPQPLSEYAHSIEASQVDPHTQRITFSLGTAESPAEHVHGVEVTLFVPEDQLPASDLHLKTASSWMGAPSELEVNLTTMDSLSGTAIHISVMRQDGIGKNGSGMVFELFWEGRNNDVHLTSPSLGGGLVMVENIDFKRRNDFNSPDLSPTFSLYPNPATDVVHLNWSGPGSCQAQLLDQRGSIQRQLHFEGNGSLDLQDLPPAVYILRLQTSQQVIHRNLIVR